MSDTRAEHQIAKQRAKADKRTAKIQAKGAKAAARAAVKVAKLKARSAAKTDRARVRELRTREREATKRLRDQHKAESGYWTPEGIEARGKANTGWIVPTAKALAATALGLTVGRVAEDALDDD